MNFYYVFTPKGTFVEHYWDKVKAMIHRVSNSGCQRFDTSDNLEFWLDIVKKHCNQHTIEIFIKMLEEQKIKRAHKISIEPIIKLDSSPRIHQGLRIVSKKNKNLQLGA